MRWLVSVGAVTCGHMRFWKWSLLLLLVTAVIWSVGMCVTPGDSRAAGIPKPLTPALHDLLQGIWGENSGLQKNPIVQFDGKGPIEAVQALSVESLVQRCPEWGAGTAQLCCSEAQLDFCLFPAVSAVQKLTGRENPSKAVRHCFQGLWRSSALPALAWSGKAVSWHERGQVCVKGRAR